MRKNAKGSPRGDSSSVATGLRAGDPQAPQVKAAEGDPDPAPEPEPGPAAEPNPAQEPDPSEAPSAPVVEQGPVDENATLVHA